jgi:hypothetical protein
MGKSVRAHTVRFHNRIKKEKLQKLENRRLEAIAARAEENLAKYNMALAGMYPFERILLVGASIGASLGRNKPD